MRTHIWSLLLLLLLVSPASARPTDAKTARARQLYEEATTHYNLGEYAKALEAFQDGYRLKQDPALLFNIGQCQRQLGQYEDAARAFRAYLRESANPVNRDDVQKLIADMDRMAADRAAQRPPTGVTPPEGEPAKPEVVKAAPEVTLTSGAPPPLKKKKQPTWVWVVVGVAGAVVVGTAVGLGVGLSQGTSAPSSTLGSYGATFQ